MLIEAQDSTLLVIDVQERLLPGVHEHETLVKNCRWLIEVAQLMDVPVRFTEQYPKGVGPTTDQLLELAGDANPAIAKTVFSCADAPECASLLSEARGKTFVLCGMEAHVCVMQTALGLHQAGNKVFVVADAISARNPLDTESALQRLRDEGVRVVTREMVGFEWVRDSLAPQFKTFSQKFLR
ncbi:putative isochorismatase hydrolase [Alcanivorax balearicus MACL04]|uniref:Isochorismatase hydrolase n=1 Tax=Alloalcanivorax balearicus MACL04 TaxID=1177182 RepID=A0ABT2R1U7_9GAMM|nr:isochorismatase family protein [Alloalcanivorax balearicus]MCU5783734.1 putative isochorismatase hydrolase [Alloalcanivorax balearicus MACL04]